nr:hypothetical protein [Desulfobacteraceae bacterium]
MKGILVHYLCTIALALAMPQAIHSQEIPFSTNHANLTIWNGSEFVPFFINGTNLGVAVPGTFPGELTANNKHYSKWFTSIKEAGLNCVRIYTLHPPRFYEVLDSFNLANPQHPLLFIQGVWLNELLPEHQDDLYHLTDTFSVEIEENIDAVHGNRVIAKRRGKAYGTYSTDVSKWCIAYIIGREVFPKEVLKTNKNHPEARTFSGHHFSIRNSAATEVWFVSQLDDLVDYEYKNYSTQRPVSISSWPTLDPLAHPEEINRVEDTVALNLSEIVLTDAPAGLFM